MNTTIRDITGKRGNLKINYNENGDDLNMEADEVLLAVGICAVVVSLPAFRILKNLPEKVSGIARLVESEGESNLTQQPS